MTDHNAISPLRRWTALFLFTLVLGCNYLDRFLLSILLEPIKTDLAISDTQAGLLTGAAFALFYSAFAIPLARLAERVNRVWVLAASLLLWSVATALCGAVTGFVTLLLARMLVGVGEAGGIPPSHSMVADLFAPTQRGGAMSILALGVAAGATLAPLIGGPLEAMVGWRLTFVILGAPGALLALALAAFVREPPRGHSEGLVHHGAPAPLWATVLTLWRRRAFRNLVLGMALLALCEYSLFLWLPTVFRRSFGLTGVELGAGLALFQGLPYAVATLAGGMISDRLYRRDRRWAAWVPLISALVALPAVAALSLASTPLLAFVLIVPPFLASGLALGPCYAMIQSLAEVRSRATATAILLFAVNIVGGALGPLMIGMLSDALTARFGEQALRFAFLALTPLYLGGALAFFAVGRSLEAGLREAAGDEGGG
ncbi:spinster family MFS transporter [Caulobacter soli]|uniref:spinster family MFS transporter n=1 Tax=Caulobacter soli TaxID=2708539 RepID=UPI0013EDDF35|nr:MFS transporter [Caulobacter soli]